MEVTIPRRRIRLLVVEDSEYRIESFQKWIPRDILAVFTTSAGAAIGILKRDKGKVYSGILLDHDLKRINPHDLTNGRNVVSSVMKYVSNDTPVLVHSANETADPVMAKLLRGAGFSVTRIPFANLTEERLLDWLEEVRENFHDDEVE